MGAEKLKVCLACLTIVQWWTMFAFLNAYIRTWKICFTRWEQFKGNTCKSILFALFMCFCGFPCFGCVFCCFGIVDVWEEPCQAFQEEPDAKKAYHKLVYLEKSSAEESVNGMLDKMFN